ncbi:MAG: phytanoyl-CoA dioxygenase family protein [Campylobacterota bacterium]|nr:phytanoyl-CoA dioxygenase family protein [Campylobacterota bacterium]
MTLTQEQLDQFNRDGFLLLRGFANPNECEAILEVAQKELEAKCEPIESEGEYTEDNSRVGTVRRLRQVYGRSPIFARWMENVEIRPTLKQVLGETPVITIAHHNSIMTKMPRQSSQTCWHQDIRYWHFEGDNLVSVWLALGDEYNENGVLEFIPTSHKMEFSPEQFDEKLYFLDNEKNRDIINTKVSYDLRQGDIVLFHAKTLHRANANQTDDAKISFVYTVRGISTTPIKGTRSDRVEDVILE